GAQRSLPPPNHRLHHARAAPAAARPPPRPSCPPAQHPPPTPQDPRHPRRHRRAAITKETPLRPSAAQQARPPRPHRRHSTLPPASRISQPACTAPPEPTTGRPHRNIRPKRADKHRSNVKTFWSPLPESNRRPSPYHGSCLWKSTLVCGLPSGFDQVNTLTGLAGLAITDSDRIGWSLRLRTRA